MEKGGETGMAAIVSAKKRQAMILAVVFFLLAAGGYRLLYMAGFCTPGTLRGHYREWPYIESERFVVRFTGADRELAGLIAKEAETAAAKVADVLPHQLAADKPWLVIVPDQATMKKAFGWGEGSGALGVYLADTVKVLSPRAWKWLPAKDRFKAFAAEGPLVHEYTHFVLDLRAGGNYTYWFSEGLAQLAEFKINGYEWLEADSSLGRGIFASTALDRALNRPETQARAYRQALSLVTYLEIRQGPEGLNRFIDVLGLGTPFDQALREVYGFDRAGLWQQWEEYFPDDTRWFLTAGRK
jgi:hypothetical protein